MEIRFGMGLPMKTGNGKIANIPRSLRDELNYRLSDGDPGNELVTWLNSKPEVVEVVNELFDGTPISEQNLSEWRKRGYQKWLAHRNAVDESNALSDNAEDLAETGIDCDKLLLTLAASYAEMIHNWVITPAEQMIHKLAVYKNLTHGVIALRRAEIHQVRLEIERERLALLREKRRDKSASSEAPQSGAVSTQCSSSENASSPESAPDFNQSSAPEGSSPNVESPAPPDGPGISQNIAPAPPVSAPTPSVPVPPPNFSARLAQRANVPQNAPPGTVISLHPLRLDQKPALRPAACPAIGASEADGRGAGGGPGKSRG